MSDVEYAPCERCTAPVHLQEDAPCDCGTVRCHSCGPCACGECEACEGHGEMWDGRTREHDTGQPVTATCSECRGTGERVAA